MKNRNTYALFISIVTVLCSKQTSAAHFQYEACAPIYCAPEPDSSPNVSFPFHVPGRQEPYCGLPGFELYCSTEVRYPVLRWPEPENEYVVEQIYYRNRSFHVYNAAVLRPERNGNTCPPGIQNTTLPVPLGRFDFAENTSRVYLFSGCPNPLPDYLAPYGVSNCDVWDLAIYEGDGNLGVAAISCGRNVVLPVGGYNGDFNDEGRNVISNVTEVLRGGFELSWTASDCGECEDSGGRCGFNVTTYHFRCFCPDRPHLRSCKPTGASNSNCPSSFECGSLGTLEFPLSDRPGCGLILLNCSFGEVPLIQFEAEGTWYTILENMSTNRFLIFNPLLHEHKLNKSCLGLMRNVYLPQLSPSISFQVSPNLTFFMCPSRRPDNNQPIQYDCFKDYNRTNCSLFDMYYRKPAPDYAGDYHEIYSNCSMVQVPINSTGDSSRDLWDLMSPEYVIEWNVSEECYRCHHEGGKCLTTHTNRFHCDRGRDKLHVVLISSLVSGGGVLLIVGFLFAFKFWQRKKRINQDYLLSRNMSFDPSSKPDIEGGSSYFGIPIFSYTELEKATNNFDPSKELGDGGFGTVYYGKLLDGREVAIKRLYEHNYRRVEQFMNEIKILTCLRHKNLVSLYGCTSRRSRELLLVYEYISNGTVAEHLHGERPGSAPLSWPVRLSIALETADALAYLHKSDIIHRDVKTCNILLDANFCVKVADFGLSRLFPNNVTHISTAPQGTPGYVDPDYHQCYQLTDKSDVYSFGVVLIELISSLPAVDITRHRHEINLANLAVNIIQRCAFDELIDKSLGYDTDSEVARMTTLVAELAFRCLQLDKDMRPSMDEVVEFLNDIKGGEDCRGEKVKGYNGNCTKIPPSPEADDAVLLNSKKSVVASPNAVIHSWISSSSTATSSVG